jgi:hypothetical protein
VVSGELSDALLDQLSALSSEVFLPMVAASAGSGGAPEVVAKGVAEGMHKFVASGVGGLGLCWFGGLTVWFGAGWD